MWKKSLRKRANIMDLSVSRSPLGSFVLYGRGNLGYLCPMGDRCRKRTRGSEECPHEDGFTIGLTVTIGPAVIRTREHKGKRFVDLRGLHAEF